MTQETPAKDGDLSLDLRIEVRMPVVFVAEVESGFHSICQTELTFCFVPVYVETRRYSKGPRSWKGISGRSAGSACVPDRGVS